MATSTFDRKIVINDDESADNLIKILLHPDILFLMKIGKGVKNY